VGMSKGRCDNHNVAIISRDQTRANAEVMGLSGKMYGYTIYRPVQEGINDSLWIPFLVDSILV
jgi:hypothetical protein